MNTELFNPLDKRNLGISIADAIFKQEVYPLKTLPSFNGAGVYAIYYNGNFPSMGHYTPRQTMGGKTTGRQTRSGNN